ncbi:hypothetical protein PXK01_01140 [Phaeobacter sp. PT47_59]|uniref:hypothetical protein n=1 Tax=Phaeobacter sp. PT47_59 TaxID=3029979 RepID=UPI00238040E1|nr:hypothetical protein [Phaeobacter sp. PT47_59]MDE4172735.1 hypothetical protein [Phaeobacter sp. PT47_59]
MELAILPTNATPRVASRPTRPHGRARSAPALGSGAELVNAFWHWVVMLLDSLRSAKNSVCQKIGNVFHESNRGGAFELAFGIVPLIAAPVEKGKEEKDCGKRQNDPEKHGFDMGARVDNTSWRLCPC